ncbi:MAG: autotransporter domain-containing protein [Rhodospirillales bacterium]|nr:autotransporter domain-containing protein [Rhodospirillales bacterium]
MKTIKAALLGTVCATPVVAVSTTAEAQITTQVIQYQNAQTTGATGIRGDNMTASYNFTGGTGGLLYRLSTGTFSPLPQATANGSNYPGAISSQPYGPTFGDLGGILKVTGTFIPATGQPDSSFIFDSAAAPGQQYTTVNVPGAANTIAHSQFGNQVVGNFNTTTPAGSAFIYNAATSTFTTYTKPGAASTSAYGIWGNTIAGGYTDPGPGGLGHAYLLNQTTGVFTQYDAPGATIATHFEGITAGGRAGEFNLVANSIDVGGGLHTWAVHVDAAGVATWTEVTVPGGTNPTGNSVYADKVIGIVTFGSTVKAYIATIAGFYNPVTNAGTLVANTNGATVISATNGDDVLNTGTIVASAPNSTGIASGTFGVIQNRGTVIASGAGSTAVQINGNLGSFINTGLVSATSGAIALGTGPTAVSPTIVNAGVIDGQVVVGGGQYTRFQNSGWMGISAAGSGVTHTTSGVFAQTSTGTLALRVGPTTSDSLQVNGAARLNGTALASFQPGALGNSYTLVSATGGYTGTFSTLATQNLPGFLSASLSYGTNVTLNLTSGFANTSGLGGDQISVGRALDSTFNAGGGLGAMPALFNLPSSQIPSALSQLSGDSASLSQTSAFAAGAQFTNLMSGRSATRRAEELAEAPCTAKADANACEPQTSMGANWAVWANGFAGTQWLNADSVTGAPASQASVAGGAFGADYRFAPNALVGLAVGLSDSNYWMPTSNATGRATGTHVGLYGAYDWSGFYLNAAIAYSRFDGNATRVVTGIGTTETERSSGVSSQLAGRVEFGRPFNISEVTGGQVAVTPFVALQPAQLWTPGMTETSSAQSGGTGVFGLTYQPQATTSLPSFLGAQVDAQTQISGRPLNAWVRASWVHEFLTDRNVTAGFQVLPGTSFTVDGARAASDAARIDLGVKYMLGSQTSLFANGNVELSGRGQSLAGTIGLRFMW